MTYTFKLARRLAVSRHLSMLPAFLLFAACAGGDATAPDGSQSEPPVGSQWRPRDITPVAVQVEPSSVTLETNQLIHFRAHARNASGDSVGAAVTWSTTGGTILPDGRFSAAAIGTYKVIGRNRARGEVHVDTSIVVVVRHQPKLESVEVNPVSSSLTPGVKQSFTAVGHLVGGTAVPIGANWSATGGTVDGGGSYTAGDTAGTFQVIATNTAGTLADTAKITITVPPAPEPPPSPEPPPGSPPPPPPPPAPVLEKVTLVPATATLAASTKRQFSAYGRTTAGDSVAVPVVFTATGGTVTSNGLFTAGSNGGTFRVVATSGSLADTSAVTITMSSGGGTASGLAFGAFHVPPDSLNRPSLGYTGAVLVASASSLKADLDRVRARGGRIVLGLSRSKTKDANGLSVAATDAELARWQAAADLNPYLADGTIIAIYVSDDITSTEWGPAPPYLSRIDSLAGAVKARWPSAPTIVRAKPTELSGHTWRWLDAGWAQYRGPYRDGTPAQFRDIQVASAKAQKLGLVIALNVLDGGCGLTPACLPGVSGTGILGTFAGAASVRRFQMSAAEVLAYGKVFVAEPYNCGFIGWRWSPSYPSTSLPAAQLAAIRAFDTRADVRAAMGDLSIQAGQRASTSCKQR
jgi:hypothetical protein